MVPYCPRCGTALSSHEVAQGYKDVTERSAVVRFAVKGTDNTYLLAWTTTPWTLPSNVALCVNAQEDYATVEQEGKKYILAKALVQTHFGEDAEISSICKGSELVGMEYVPLFDFQPGLIQQGRAFTVVADGYVTLTDGTGIVHIAPAFGEDDSRVGRANDLAFLQMVDAKGEFIAPTPWEGTFAKTADPMILQDLKDRGLLFSAPEFTHSYPFCWRCDTPLLYYARSSWFIEMTKLRDALLQSNQSVNWMPDNIKDGRMGNFLENVVDWGLSRERYWGTPLPIWECECGHREAVGSIAQLQEMGENVPEDIELHKPYIDQVHLKCPKCGKLMTRVPEVIDCWYDSGSMPFAQWHYPFENKEKFEQYYPADFISEAIDQTRGWFYTLLAISTALFGRSPFKNCIVLGHVQDKDGQKMSKHKGNVVDPWTVLNKQGADAVRWYFYSSSAPWLPCRFYDEAVSEAQRKFMGTLWNTYAFYVLYADIDSFDPTSAQLPQPEYNVMDRWVQSRLHQLIDTVTQHLDAYRVTEAARAIGVFVDELSNWYLRRSRERFWGKEMTPDKAAAFLTLYDVLKQLSLLIAPFVPFMAESIYQNIVRRVEKDAPESVHMCDYPIADASKIDSELTEGMECALKVVTIGRAARSDAGIKNRQPLSGMMISGHVRPNDEIVTIILQELNVKELMAVDNASEYVSHEIKPQLRTLGPKYGKLLGGIRTHLQQADCEEILQAVKDGGSYTFEVQGSMVELKEEDLLVSTCQKPGFCAASESGMTVVLNTELTPELLEEGMVREIVSKIQAMRREADFNVTDHILISFASDAQTQAVYERNYAAIAKDVLADGPLSGQAEIEQEVNINGKKAVISLRRS